jgi:hypothetical protein
MGVERTAVSAKLSPENLDFLDERMRLLRPYTVSMSSLVDLCVRIVRQLNARGDLSLEPERLRALLTTDRSEIVAETSRRLPANQKQMRVGGRPGGLRGIGLGAGRVVGSVQSDLLCSWQSARNPSAGS